MYMVSQMCVFTLVLGAIAALEVLELVKYKSVSMSVRMGHPVHIFFAHYQSLIYYLCK